MCLEFEILSAYADDELKGSIREDVEQHLLECIHCSSIVQDIKNVGNTLHSLNTPGISANFTDNLFLSLPQTKPCPVYSDLSAYADHTLNFSQTKEILEHLEECEICKQKLKDIREISRNLKTLPDAYKSSDTFIDNLMARIPQKDIKVIDFDRWKQKFKPARVAIAAGFALVGVLVFSNYYYNNTQMDMKNKDTIYITAEEFLFSTDSNPLQETESATDLPLIEENPG